ncbi:MAG: hypothetical protein ACOH13_10235 [Flavobacteriales bacterium]
MCLKELGVELPMMRGTRPMVVAHIHYAGEPVHQLKLRQSSLCCRAPLTPEMKAVLDQDRRQRGEHRPKRLVLGRCLRDPYFFFSAKLPHGGLHLPHHDLAALAVEVEVVSPQPLFDHAFLLHLKGSEPRIHPFGQHLRWVAHRQWGLAEQWARLTHHRQESPCGCRVQVRFSFAPLGPVPPVPVG